MILRTSEWLFLALKLMGAAYLFYLGIGLLRTKRGSLDDRDAGRRGRWGKLFLDGAFSNLSNPKVAISISRSCRNSCRLRRSIRR